MKTLLLILSVAMLLGTPTSAFARLGESEAAVIERYGKPKYKLHRAWGDEEGFSMNGFTIAVTLINGVSVGELFSSPGHTISEEQMVDLLAANCEGHAWTDAPSRDISRNAYPPIKQMWERPNGSTAVLTNSSMEFKSIFLILAQQDVANQKPASPNTQGF